MRNIVKINERVTNVAGNDIHNGTRKAKLDYYTKGLDYALKNNAWLLNSQSEEYAKFIREFYVTISALYNIVNRIDKIRDTSNNLKELIKKELEKRQW